MRYPFHRHLPLIMTCVFPIRHALHRPLHQPQCDRTYRRASSAHVPWTSTSVSSTPLKRPPDILIFLPPAARDNTLTHSRTPAHHGVHDALPLGAVLPRTRKRPARGHHPPRHLHRLHDNGPNRTHASSRNRRPLPRRSNPLPLPFRPHLH
jgi:hypothetical protein